jgi:hypothetical protein
MNLSERRGYENGLARGIETLRAMVPAANFKGNQYLFAGVLFGAYCAAHEVIVRECLFAEFSGQRMDPVHFVPCFRCHHGVITSVVFREDEFSEEVCKWCEGDGYVIELKPGEAVYLPPKNPCRTGNSEPTRVTVECHKPHHERLDVQYSDGHKTTFHMPNSRIKTILQRTGPNG